MKYPYLIYELNDLPTERWKDVPEFEDYYQVSSFGRIRSLDRYVNHKTGRPILIKGRLLKQSVYKYYNKTVEDHKVALRVSLSKHNKRYDFQVRRLVYQAFKAGIKSGFNIVNKDGDGYNNMISNLVMISDSTKQKRSIDKGRQIPSLINADRSSFNKIYGGYSRQKRITQTSLDGQFSKTYVSIREAARRTGFDDKSIINCAKGRWKQYNGYTWEYAESAGS